jgi:hypothetical protein
LYAENGRRIVMKNIVYFYFFFALASCGRAQESLKVAKLNEPPPRSVSPELQGALAPEGIRVQDGQGQTHAEIWLRSRIPCTEKPSGAKGAVQLPFLADSELVGVLQFVSEGHDYREQPIAKGVYTMRFGLQPVNGDHLGVSTYRDYILLLPAAKDPSTALLPRKQLEERSAQAAGTSHPAAFLLLLAPPGSKADPAAVHDAEKNTWSVVLPLNLQVKGQNEPIAYPVQLVVVGAAAA